MNTVAPLPANELDRVITLSDYNLDYTSLEDTFADLTRLAASVTGGYISLVNIIDTFTQWSVATSGIPFDALPREESVCQWTINETHRFEVKDLTTDARFSNRKFVINDRLLTFYYGVPLKTSDGHCIGALCVLNEFGIQLSPEKEEMLTIIGNEIINRLNAIKTIEALKSGMQEANESKKRVAHDIRGPLAGIIGLAGLISEQGEENQLDEVLEFVKLIHKSGHSLLELADEILSTDTPKADAAPKPDEFNQIMLKEKLEKLYTLQAKNKQINFKVTTSAQNEAVPFSKNKLLQIIGNLISNAIKFTPVSGKVSVNLMLSTSTSQNTLKISVSDSGVGIDDEQIKSILAGTCSSTNGTSGEQGYGFGLALVKHLIDGLKGTLRINSSKGAGTTFEVDLPQRKA